MNKNFTPPSKKPTEKIEEKLNIEPDRHFVVALQTGHCLDFHNKCSFVKFERRLAFFQNQKKEITLAIIPINNINYILNKEN